MQFYIEERDIINGATFGWDMAHHLYARYRSGVVVVVADRPKVVLATVRKQWFKIIAKLKNEHSRTLNKDLKNRLKNLVEQMETMPFTVGQPPVDTVSNLGIYILDPIEMQKMPNKYRTIYWVASGSAQMAKPYTMYKGAIIRYEPV